MKCILPISNSVRILRRSNLVPATSTTNELINDIYYFIEEIFFAAEKNSLEEVLDEALSEYNFRFESYAYTKVIFSAIKDDHELMSHLSNLITSMRDFETITLVSSTSTYLVISLKV